MKAILLLITFISVNSFASEHRELIKIQKAQECTKNPEYCMALEVHKADVQQVKKLEAQLARLEREKAFVCKPPAHFSDHGLLASIDTQFEYMKSCKASVKYTEDAAKIDSKISEVIILLNLALQDREQSRVAVSYFYAARK